MLCTIKQAPLLPDLFRSAGKDDYHAYVVAPKRSLLEVMQDFPSARPSLGACQAAVSCDFSRSDDLPCVQRSGNGCAEPMH